MKKNKQPFFIIRDNPKGYEVITCWREEYFKNHYIPAGWRLANDAELERVKIIKTKVSFTGSYIDDCVPKDTKTKWQRIKISFEDLMFEIFN